jgi:hypothetical protein
MPEGRYVGLWESEFRLAWAKIQTVYIIPSQGGTQGQSKKSPSELPPPADTDAQLTQELQLLEQQLGEAALHMDTNAETAIPLDLPREQISGRS